MVPGSDQDPHRLPRREGLGEEPAGVDAGALVLVEVPADRDRRAAQLHRQPSGTRECFAEPLPAPPRELPLAAHGGEHPIEVEVGEMEETCRHGAGIESANLGANVSSHRLSQVYLPIFWHN